LKSVAKIILLSQVSVILHTILTLPIEFFDQNGCVVAEVVVAPKAVYTGDVLVATLI
jgi:hypothetical protein